MKALKRLSLFFILVLLSTTLGMGQKLKVMTYNIRLDIESDGENSWSNRKEFLANQIKFYEPDILGTQEGRPNQIAYLKDALSAYNYVGHGREGGDKGEYSAIFYKTQRFTVVRDSTFWLSKTPYFFSKGWDAAYPRICTYGLFTDLRSLKKFWVFNTHLDHVGEKARQKGLELIQKKISEINTENHPVIFMGDLNAEPDSKLITSLNQSLTDSKSIAKLVFGPSGTFNGFNFKESVTKRIDYIFFTKAPEIRIKKYAVLSDSKNLKYPSDHLPVFVELKLQ
jgi:endonuclease/exonuclease/phosphatase family metal-dependent hydrolase